ncbi:DUF488 domain-containing protein [Sporosarcina sp. Marseille-Q4063]|uniref:DUF488 domain-containing protein n=1 Tax=Sporosarcina sp. Marseille-Q4063 TaxID=2810514 RepID=UPI001BAEA25A|nr:DUF488 domain-containing protein [Sporosarcina sp. Marseille-Q4063]QUW21419.1 DUF488 domain-containing protein [Sporosarcina sp. Marseille-Q4063]
MPVNIKRAYDDISKKDGVRILVDRLWPRGISKEDLQIDHWMKEVAPSDELRKWFDHETEKFEGFKKKYKKELDDNNELMEELKDIVIKHKKNVTLVYGAKDEEHNQAVVLKEILDRQQV